MKSTLVKTTLSIAIATASFGLSTSAFAGASANIGFMSDYVWRGWSQNDGDPSISAGLDYEAGNGLYVGTWAANVDNDGDNYELDLYAGYAGEVSKFTYDIGLVSYMYPNATDLDFAELYVNGTYESHLLGSIGIGLASTISADDANQEGNLYKYVSLGGTAGPFGYKTTIGHTSFDAAGADDVLHTQLAVNYAIEENMGELTLAFDSTDEAGADMITSLSWTKGFDF
jgi:uncharacterized protein (TIGR02001 family)